MSKDKKHRYYGNNTGNADKRDKKVEDTENLEEATRNDKADAEIVDNFDAIEDGDERAAPDSAAPETEKLSPEEKLEKEVASLKEQLEKEKKEYLFLMAEFDNFRKRTLKEKSEIIKNAGEKVFKGLLPIVDDMERGIKASEEATDVATVREGLVLIYNKLVKFMEANGVKAYDESDDNFDAERHEAITAVPVQDESKKGKILDTIEKGYTINDKVLRHARVVVGQ